MNAPNQVRCFARNPVKGCGICRRIVGVWAVLSFLFALSACGLFGHDGNDKSSDEKAASRVTIFSPNGEPLSGGPLGHPTCSDALNAWFDRTDANHDGTVTLDEFLADTRRQFAVMDINHDGAITPGELDAYRRPFGVIAKMAPLPGNEREPSKDTANEDESTGGLGSSSHNKSSAVALDQADPVMSADVNLRYQVSLADFVAYEKKRFALLDIGHNGHLTKVEVVAGICGKP